MLMTYSIGRDARHATHLQQVAGSFDSLAQSVLATRDRAGKDGPYICGPLCDGRRNTESALPILFCALDLDAVPDELAMLRIVEAAEKWQGLGYTTHSHRPEAGIFKLRLLFELDRAVSRSEYSCLCAAMAAGLSKLAGLPVVHDPACAKPEQPLYTARQGATVWTFNGDPVRVNQVLASVPEAAEVAPAALDRIKTVDTALIALRDAGRILRDMGGGKYAIRCLFEAEHSRAHTDDDTSTVYLLPHTGGFALGHFKCQHQHCQGRTDDDFRTALGLNDSDDVKPDDAPVWSDPQPLVAKIVRQPYPVDALPDDIRAAVQEVAGFVKAPFPLVATSALAAVSVASQVHADVKRAERLQGPSGLYLLAIADSGERKTTCDSFFSSAIREYEAEQAELAKPILKKHAADMAAWTAERDGILSAIKEVARKGKPADKQRTDLIELEHDRPDPPRVPRLIYGDATPEALTWSLAKCWPAGGVISSEAGAIFGAHGMGRESIMRNLAILNELWDGRTQTFDRRKEGGSFTVRGARLTVALQVQEATLREFFARSGSLARGTGFLARFLIAWPESTQGMRPFTEAPAAWPALAAFHRRVGAILRQPMPMDDDGGLTPPALSLAPDAKAAWIEFHNAIEGELASGGELYDVRDVASKAADNAARLAALFHVFNGIGGGAIGAEAFAGASRIVAWHLNESRRFFGELALPAELSDAARLDSWLIDHCRRGRVGHADRREAQRGGPVRDGERLIVALRVLAELDRAREGKHGKRKLILLNPALLASQA